MALGMHDHAGDAGAAGIDDESTKKSQRDPGCGRMCNRHTSEV
jgi:hypothetical protein